MYRYKNTSRYGYEFYGVQFAPGSEHDVPHPIHHPAFISVRKVSNSKNKSTEVVDTVAESVASESDEVVKTVEAESEQIVETPKPKKKSENQ